MEVLATLVYMLLAYFVTMVVGVTVTATVVNIRRKTESKNKVANMAILGGFTTQLLSVAAAVAVLVYKVWPYL